ncbi:MAG: phosphoribosylanthranilate isomerase, partial [Bacteroidota bacterium]
KLQPDYLGFIFYNKSSRYFEGKIPELSSSIKKVGVFVNASIQEVTVKISEHDLDAVQLHGKESPEYCRELVASEIIKEGVHKKQFKIIKVFSVDINFDFSQLEAYENLCDYYLFDTKGKLPGGNGYTFNWNILKNYPSTKPYFLSGGIGIEEIKSISEFMTKPESKFCHAIDVNSKFEIEPGLKNIDLIKEFKKNVNLNGFKNHSSL